MGWTWGGETIRTVDEIDDGGLEELMEDLRNCKNGNGFLLV